MNYLIKIIIYCSIISLSLCSSPSSTRIKTADSPLDKIIEGERFIPSDSDNIYHSIKVRGEVDPGFLDENRTWKGNCIYYDYHTCRIQDRQNYIKVGGSFLSYYKNYKAEQDGPYINYYRKFIPEYIYKLRITNYGYTKKNIDIIYENHCPPTMLKFLYFEEDNLQNLLSYLTFSLYNRTDLLVICFDPTRMSNSIERDKK